MATDHHGGQLAGTGMKDDEMNQYNITQQLTPETQKTGNVSIFAPKEHGNEVIQAVMKDDRTEQM